MVDTFDAIFYIITLLVVIGGVYEIITAMFSLGDYIWAVIGAIVGIILVIFLYFKLKP